MYSSSKSPEIRNPLKSDRSFAKNHQPASEKMPRYPRAMASPPTTADDFSHA
jgi:hypothetical protein